MEGQWGKIMEIIFQGQHNTEDAKHSITEMLRLFKEKYNINHFREICLSVTLVDDQGNEVELVDSETNEAFRVFEVRQQPPMASSLRLVEQKGLQLVVDNTKPRDESSPRTTP